MARPTETERIKARYHEMVLSSLDVIREYEKYIRKQAEQGKAEQASGYADRLATAAQAIVARITALDAIREMEGVLSPPPAAEVITMLKSMEPAEYNAVRLALATWDEEEYEGQRNTCLHCQQDIVFIKLEDGDPGDDPGVWTSGGHEGLACEASPDHLHIPAPAA